MKLSYAQVVKRPALLERLTGLKVKEFEALRESFSSQYDQQVIKPRVNAPGRQVQQEEDKKEPCQKWQTNCSLSWCIQGSTRYSLSKGSYLGWQKVKHAPGWASCLRC